MEITKPFHESIVDAINDCRTIDKLEVFARLVLDTKIPQNHKKILDAFNRKGAELRWSYSFLKDLLKEKLSIEKAEAEKK